ncbi:hypothetical protein LTR28_007704 [Elasticomyces elasticus]|nr:hypothetical protein LTR28_007704 [Elasticomyces elasticus]
MLASSLSPLKPLRRPGLGSTDLGNSACIFATYGDDRYILNLLLFVRVSESHEWLAVGGSLCTLPRQADRVSVIARAAGDMPLG